MALAAKGVVKNGIVGKRMQALEGHTLVGGWEEVGRVEGAATGAEGAEGDSGGSRSPEVQIARWEGGAQPHHGPWPSETW